MEILSIQYLRGFNRIGHITKKEHKEKPGPLGDSFNSVFAEQAASRPLLRLPRDSKGERKGALRHSRLYIQLKETKQNKIHFLLHMGTVARVADHRFQR